MRCARFSLTWMAMVWSQASMVKADEYTVVDLGVIPASSINAVNNAGQVTGYNSRGAFLSAFDGGRPRVLGTTGLHSAFGAVGNGINSTGQVAGNTYSDSGGSYAFLSGPDGGAPRDLGSLGGGYSQAWAVNDSGQVTGYSTIASRDANHAFLSGPDGGTLKDLGTIDNRANHYSIGASVNASGRVAGFASIGAGYTIHAFLSGAEGGPLTDLGTLGGEYSYATAVNVLGRVAGYSTYPGSLKDTFHAFLSGVDGGALQDLGTLGGNYSQALGLNDPGQVVGDSLDASGRYRAFLYTGASPTLTGLNANGYLVDGQMTDLNSLIVPGSGFTLGSARSITDSGYILASGDDSAGYHHSLLLVPSSLSVVPEPSALVLLSTGIAILVAWSRRRKPI